MAYSLSHSSDSSRESDPGLNWAGVAEANSGAPSSPAGISIELDKRTGTARVIRARRPLLRVLPNLGWNGVEKGKPENFTPRKGFSTKLGGRRASYFESTPTEAWAKLLVYLVGMAAVFLLLPPALLVLLPAILLFRQAYCYAPRPPGSLKFTLAALVLAFVPGGLAFCGCLAAWFELLGQVWSWLGNSKSVTRQQLGTVYRLFTGPFQPFVDKPLESIAGALVFAALPSYSVLLVYFLWYRPQSDKALVEQHMVKFHAEEAEKAAAKEREQAARQLQVAQEATALASHKVILLGEAVERRWLFPAMQWELSQRPAEEKQYHWLNLNNLVYHLISCGATRSGKSVNLARPVIQYAIANRIGAVIIDPKGDLLTPADTSLNFSVAADEIGQSCRLCLIDDQVSLTTAARNFAEAVIDMDEISPDSRFFVAWARRALSTILIGYRVVYGQWPELLQVLVYASNPDGLRKLLANLRKVQADANRDLGLRHRAEEQLLEFQSLVNLMPGKSKTNPFETVANSIQALATEKYRQAVTTNTRYGKTIRQILEEGLTARFSYNLSEGEVSRQLNRVIVRQFTTFAMEPVQGQWQGQKSGQAKVLPRPRSRPKLLVVDEASEVICEALGTLVTKGAGREAGAVLLFQNLSQVRDSRLAHDIFANCRTKLVLSGTSSDTARIFSELSGTCVVPMLTDSAGISDVQSQGVSRNSGAARGRSNSSQPAGVGTSASHSFQESFSQTSSRSQGRNRAESKVFRERPCWNPGEIMSLPRFHALAWLYDGSGDIEMQLLKFVSPAERKVLVPVVRPPRIVLDREFSSGVTLQELQPHGKKMAGAEAEEETEIEAEVEQPVAAPGQLECVDE